MTGLSYPTPLLKELLINARRLPWLKGKSVNRAKVNGEPAAGLLVHIGWCLRNNRSLPPPTQVDFYRQGGQLVGSAILHVDPPHWHLNEADAA